jgi:hypothetical protein
MSRWQDRIVRNEDGTPKIVRAKAQEIAAHKFNPKFHPERQKQALAGELHAIGKTRVLFGYYSPKHNGLLTLVDGHLRQSLDPNELWDVVVLDLTDDEAAQELALADEIGAMFERDDKRLTELLRDTKELRVDTSGALQTTWDELTAKVRDAFTREFATPPNPDDDAPETTDPQAFVDALPYAPNLQPSFDDDDGDTDAEAHTDAAASLAKIPDGNATVAQSNMIDVYCPHCQEKFYLNRTDLMKDW